MSSTTVCIIIVLAGFPYVLSHRALGKITVLVVLCSKLIYIDFDVWIAGSLSSTASGVAVVAVELKALTHTFL
jgi:hypothetical protein